MLLKYKVNVCSPLCELFGHTAVEWSPTCMDMQPNYQTKGLNTLDNDMCVLNYGISTHNITFWYHGKNIPAFLRKII